jgi:hypothetical protein
MKMPIKEMTNKETVVHLREYVTKIYDHFSWPTDGCGYEQHIRFVEHRNQNWHGPLEEWNKFVLDYADMLEKED